MNIFFVVVDDDTTVADVEVEVDDFLLERQARIGMRYDRR